MRHGRTGRREDSGFTLIELLVVIVIIGILAGIAIPLMIKNKRRAYDASLTSTLRDAATAQEAYSGEAGTYTTSLDDLKSQGYQTTEDVDMTVALVPGGYCMSANRPGNARPLYMTNTGPEAGRPTAVACG